MNGNYDNISILLNTYIKKSSKLKDKGIFSVNNYQIITCI